MKRIVLLLLLTGLSGSVHAQAAVKAIINTNIPDNNSGFTTPLRLRTTLNAMVDYTTTATTVISATSISASSYAGDGSNLTVSPTGAITPVSLGTLFGQRTNVTLFGTAGDGVTDDFAAISQAYNSTALSGTLYFPYGTYLISGTNGLIVSKSINIACDPGAKILFNSGQTQGLRIQNTSNVSVNDCTFDGQAVSRTNYPLVMAGPDGNNVHFNHISSLNSPGVGIGVVSSTDIWIDNAYVYNSQADGIHLTNSLLSYTGPVKRATITSPILENTQDDAVSVVSYIPSGDVCEDITISGLVFRNSAASGLGIIGAKGVWASGVIDGAKGNNAFKAFRDNGGSNTWGVYDTYANVIVRHSAAANGQSAALVGKNVYDSAFDIQVDDTSNTGVLIGSGDLTPANYPQRIKVNARVVSATGTGINISGVYDLTSDELSASNNGFYGIIAGNTSASVVGMNIGHIYTKDNSISGSFPNVFLNSPVNFSIGSLVSIDDRSPTQVQTLLRAAGVVNGSIGPRTLISGTTAVNTIMQSGNTNFSLSPNGPTFSTTYDPASILAGASTSTTINVPGVQVGDPLQVGFSSNLAGTIMTAQATGTNSVTIIVANITGATVDVSSGTVSGMDVRQ